MPTMYRLTLILGPDEEPAMSERLFALGASSVSTDYTAGDGRVTVHAVFDTELPEDDVLSAATYLVEPIEEELWKNRWIDFLQGMEINEEVYVQPVTAPPSYSREYRYLIHIDPRDAFGDGQHPTTIMCLDALWGILSAMEPERRASIRLLDAGTGTGILAILAALMGVCSIDAIDYDREAVTRAQHNFEINGCVSIASAHCDVASCPNGERYDIITANLISSVIMDNCTHLARLLAPDGELIVSGVTDRWYDEVDAFLRAQGLLCVQRLRRAEWNAFLLRHQG
jgi:ribosomal protein L11 methyltransferase